MTLILLTIAIRLTVRDAIVLTAIPFYVGQPIVLAAAAIAPAIVYARRRRMWHASLCLVLLVACTGWWLATAFGGASSPSAPRAAGRAPLRVMEWNINAAAFGWSGITETIAAERPDLIALVEAWHSRVRLKDLALLNQSNYAVTDFVGGLVLAVRGEIESNLCLPLDGGGWCRRCDVRIDGGALTVFLVDVPSNPFVSRRKPLADLAFRASGASGAVLVLGDFNTPPDSVHLEPLRREFANAFESAGAGFSPTWPLVLPVLTIDQLWYRGDMIPHRVRVLTSPRSDHRPLVAEFDLGGQ